LGNLGGFVGPIVIGYLVTKTHSFTAGLLYLVGSLCLSGTLMLLIRPERTSPSHDATAAAGR
jgi:ACS family tartrate transporter-like MFS transporter